MDRSMEAVRRLVEDLEGGTTQQVSSQADAVQRILDASKPAEEDPTLPVGVVEAEDETKNPFAFGRIAAERDRLGVPTALPHYLKRSCTVCYGRGYRIQTFGGRRYEACQCVNNGYLRALREFDRCVRASLKAHKGEVTPEVEKDARDHHLAVMFKYGEYAV